MPLLKNTVYNLFTSFLIRGSSLLALLISFNLLNNHDYYIITRFILQIEFISGVLNVISKHALMRRKYIAIVEVYGLIVFQCALGLLVFLIISLLHQQDLIADNQYFIYFSLFIALISNNTYIFESILKSRNQYRLISKVNLFSNSLSMAVYLALAVVNPFIGVIIFVFQQKLLLFCMAVFLTFRLGILRLKRPKLRPLVQYHMKYAAQNIVESASSAVYRPGMQLILGQFLLKEEANFIFLALRIVEGIFYQIPVNLTQVMYTSYLSANNYFRKIAITTLAYQFFVLLCVYIILSIYPQWNSEEYSIYFMILTCTIFPYFILLQSQNTLMYFKLIKKYILASLLCKILGIAILFVLTRTAGLFGYIIAYCLTIYVTASIYYLVSTNGLAKLRPATK